MDRGHRYRVEDLPSSCTGGWMLNRVPAGENEPVEENPEINLPGEVRATIHGVMPLPWFHQMFLSPDGAIWAVNHSKSIVNGKYQKYRGMIV
jgi:hypothetical protein